MKILLTNNALTLRAGTELYLCEVAETLIARGHEPSCFTLRPGALAEQLVLRGIAVSDDLRTLPGPPEIIHGQHFIETTLAALTYRTVPVVSFCHGPEAWQESGCRLPNVARWVAVDEACRRRLVIDEQIDEEKVITLFNHYDERKFRPRPALPRRPKRALLVNNRLTKDHPAAVAAQEACAAHGIALSMVGARFGKRVDDMEKHLPQADIVFAKARSAIEAMAVGCAVIQLAHFGAGTLITSARYDELRRWNFGYRSMTFPLSAEHLAAQIDAYQPEDAEKVSSRIREEATLGQSVDALLGIYRDAIATSSCADYDPAVAAGDFLRFHLALSKLPYEALQKTIGVPLRLPRYPIEPGRVVDAWEAIAAAHPGSGNNGQSRSDRLIGAIRGLLRRPIMTPKK